MDINKLRETIQKNNFEWRSVEPTLDNFESDFKKRRR